MNLMLEVHTYMNSVLVKNDTFTSYVKNMDIILAVTVYKKSVWFFFTSDFSSGGRGKLLFYEFLL